MGEQRRRRAGVVAVAAAGIALGAAFGPSLAGATVDKVQEVLVLNNEDSEAIATRAVGTTPVEVTGTPQVAVTGTPTVKVASSSAEPIAVQPVAPASTPVAEALQWSFSGSRDDVALYEVPAGKRLTIEHVSGDDFNRAIGFVGFVVRATTDGKAVTHRLLVSKQGTQTDVFSQSLKIVADPGTSVVFGLTLDGPLGNDSGSTAFMHGAFAGTLTDVAP